MQSRWVRQNTLNNLLHLCAGNLIVCLLMILLDKDYIGKINDAGNSSRLPLWLQPLYCPISFGCHFHHNEFFFFGLTRRQIPKPVFYLLKVFNLWPTYAYATSNQICERVVYLFSAPTVHQLRNHSRRYHKIFSHWSLIMKNQYIFGGVGLSTGLYWWSSTCGLWDKLRMPMLSTWLFRWNCKHDAWIFL